MSRIHSFLPVTSPDMRVLILGSMPGEKSLQMQQYYAHPQNVFWKIMGELVGAGRELAYPDRVERLKANDVGLWDVLASCRRPDSSLDSAIIDMQANDFTTLFSQHPSLTHVFFNGGKAEEAYRRFVLRSMPKNYDYLIYTRLPSTSPAYAGMNYQRKSETWRQILDHL